MADNKEETPQNPNPILSFFTNFINSFKFPFPKSPATNSDDPKSPEPVTGVDAGKSKSPAIVKVPVTQEVVSLKLEADGVPQDTNPVVLWQVYAIGGFFVLKWAWARWNERRAKKETKKENDEDDPPPTDN